MTKLILQNDFSYLVSEDNSLKSLLSSSLKFREKNYFHNRRYKMKIWDGYVDFFQKENGKFLTGLLPEIKAVLKKKDINYEIEDKRTKINFLYDSVDNKFGSRWVKNKKIDLYDYQVDFINQVIKHNRGVIFAPTSSGKSATMVGILKTIIPGTKILVLQNRLSLAVQNYEEICNWGFENVGRLWSGKNEPNIITVANVQSIIKIEKQLSDVEVLIVDEIHDMMSKLPKAVYRRLKNCSVRVAMSATPFKFGETDKVQKYYVKGFFGPVLKTTTTENGILTTQELQNRNILSKSKCIFYEINDPKDIQYDIYIDAVTRGIAENHNFHKIVKNLVSSLSGRTLVLVDRIAHGDMLKTLMPDSIWVQGKDNIKTRKEAIEILKKSKTDVTILATQQIFNTGVSFFCHNLINAAGGQADHMIVQRMGRGLRTADDKEILNYFDFLFRTNKYLEKHSEKRIKILRKEGHEVEIKSL
jgi:superfamily II DNA or RNA helicase